MSGVQQVSAPSGAGAPLRPLRRPEAGATTEAVPTLGADRHQTAAPRAATPAATVSLGAEAVQYADITIDGQGRILGADGRPYGGVELRYDAASDRVLDADRQPIDVHRIGSQPVQSAPTAANLRAMAGEGHPAVMLGENNRLITPDGQPFLGRELYYDPQTDQVRDADGNTVDPQSLPGWLTQRETNPNDARLVRHIRIGAGVASGTFWLGVTQLRQRCSLTGMQSRLAGLQRTSTAFVAGHGLQARLTQVPVAGAVAHALQTRRIDKAADLTRSIALATATPVQEARLRAQERLGELQTKSQTFQQGHGLLGRLKDTPVVGGAAQAIEERRQGTITRLSGDLARDEVSVGLGTRIRNATRGRIVPTLMLGVDAYGIYTGLSRWDAPGNERKWDDALRIGGNAISATGNLMTLQRGDITNGLRTVMAGVVVSSIGHMANDQH